MAHSQNGNPLFLSFQSKNLNLKNRIVMAPMTRSQSPDGVPSELTKEYYSRRAKAGVGLIITEGINIDHPASPGYPDVPVLHGDALEPWRTVVGSVHESGGKIAAQLWHVGCLRSEQFDLENRIESVSPSGVYYLPPDKTRHNTRALSLEEAEGIIASFARGARNAKDCGFDAIEIHGAHGYLVDQFFWDVTNRRDDRFGGTSLKDRTRFAVEVIEACRDATGPDFPILFRFSNWKLGSYKKHLFHSPTDLGEFLEPLTSAGVDIFHASTRNFDVPEFEGSTLNLAGWTQKISGKPTVSVGSVGLAQDFIDAFKEAKPSSIDSLVTRMAAGEFDLIAIGRALIGDPLWVQKLHEKDFQSIVPYTRNSLETLY